MKILLINATRRRQTTYHIGKELIANISKDNDSVEEVFLPDAMPEYCVGCGNCFIKDEHLCPHREYTEHIEKLIDASDLLLFVSPVYVYHTTGQMKTLLDHFGYRWMVHRPNGNMFFKQAVVISTAAGEGMKSTIKDITDSLNFWGVGCIHTYGLRVGSLDWTNVNHSIKEKIHNDMKKLSNKVINKFEKPTASIKVKALFYFIRALHKSRKCTQKDYDYWEKQGWLGKQRPWH